MKKYTQEEFDAIPRNKFGIKHCPTGDYSEIKEFQEVCIFGECCIFGEGCSFGKMCSFGEMCSFGKCCNFSAKCNFGKLCNFGKSCGFCELCNFNGRCSFGKMCSFSAKCIFGESCSFGEMCIFGEQCSCEFGEFTCMLNIGGFGSVNRTTYFWLMTDNTINVHCGCFSGTLDEWKAKVKHTYGDRNVAKAYLTAADAVVLQFKYLEEAEEE